MSTPRAINEYCFSQSYYWLEANKGMVWIRRIHLHPYQRYYRFTSYSVGKEDRISGSWWFDYENYLNILDFAKRTDLSPGYAARLKAAITYEWSSVNCVVSALLKAPLDAYAGKGKEQIEEDQRAPGRVYLPDPQIMQLYIPGLKDVQTKSVSAICKQAFPVYKFEHLVSRLFE